jgi:segregation and condensation protein A
MTATAAFTPPPQQGELGFARVQGEPWFDVPKDLYIPPDALRVILDAFEGPLDLLLYLIRRQNLDILDIPIADITRQYIGYIGLMEELRYELAAEYLLMAAILAEIKSRMLLPRPATTDAEEDDPRAELVRRLAEYERFKKAAEDLDALPRVERDTMPVQLEVEDRRALSVPPPVELKELLLALSEVLKRADLYTRHEISREPLSVRQRMSEILLELEAGWREFTTLFDLAQGRRGVIVSFLALLELAKEGLVEIFQEAPLWPIRARRARSSSDPADVAPAFMLEPGA